MKAVQLVMACALLLGAAGNVGAVGSFSIDEGSKGAGVKGGVKVMEWNFADGDLGGWKNGWNKTAYTSVDEMDVIEGLGMRLKVNFQEPEWGDSNIHVPWTTWWTPVAIKLRLLVPVRPGKPRGPMQLFCAMNNPWVEDQAKIWVDMNFPERVMVDGVEFLAQNVTCPLGTTAKGPTHKWLVLRFGGYHVRYKNGLIFIQQIRAVSSTE